MENKGKNIVWAKGHLAQEQREAMLKQKGAVLWFTGLSGSGKSTVAYGVEQILVSQGIHAMVLDGDNVRHGLNSDLGFSEADRSENIRRVAEVAKLFWMSQTIAIVSFISPFQKDREFARSLLPAGTFFEIYCQASLEECEKRDPKGLYQKARKGEIPQFTGISSPYEPPQKCELVLPTASSPLENCVEEVVRLLKGNKIF